MEFQEPFLEETLISINMKKEDELEETETLSLCDLPLYSDQSANWDHQYFSSNSNSTSSSSQDDFFEFFSQELSPSAAAFPPENIVFCGKLIPYKQLSPPCKTDEAAMIKNQTSHKKSSRWRWRLSSSKNSKVAIQSKNGNKCTTAVMRQPQRRTYNTGKQLGSTKAKWYFFLFGVSRFSSVVELSDIRNRQSRRHRSTPPPPPSPAMFGLRSGGGDKVSDRGWGLMWGLLRALSCGGGHHQIAVAAVAAGGCAPPE